MDKKLKVAIAQPLVVPGDVKGNIGRLEALVVEAAAQGAQVFVTSEGGLTGYDFGGKCVAAAISADGAEMDTVAAIARRHNMVLLVGFIERSDGKFYNSAAAVYPDGKRVVQRKYNSTTKFEVDSGILRGPRERTIFQIGPMKAAILICADCGIPDVHNTLAKQGCELVLIMSAGLGDAKKGFSEKEIRENPERRKEYLQKQPGVCVCDKVFTDLKDAMELNMCIAAANQAGYVAEMGFFHVGSGFIVDPTGEVKAIMPGTMVFEHVRPRVAVAEVCISK